MRLSVRGGLKIDLGPISENIVDIELGEFPLNPVIEKTIEVTEQPPILPGVTISISSTIFLVIAIVMIIFFFALIYYFRRRILSS